MRIAIATAAFAIAALAPGLAPAAGYGACLAGLNRRAEAAGVPASVAVSATAGMAPDMKVLDLEKSQPEFKTPVWDYLAGLVDDRRVADGRAAMAREAGALRSAQARYGVDRYVVAAIWGVESNFGHKMGDRPLLQSLSTLGCFGVRARYFAGEYVNALKIVARGDIPARRLVGSWAGAFGQTQFMPSSFLRLAVSGSGDGRRDIVDRPADALASTAHFLQRAGWRVGEPWGFEVLLPRGYSGPSGRRAKKPMSFWAARGLRRADGGAVSGPDAGLFLPAGPRGPAFLTTRNFDAIYAYNASESYSLAIGHLADRMRGGGEFRTPWPTDDPGLSRAGRAEVQRLLIARGYAIDKVDGVIGKQSQAAIADYRTKIGMSRDGRASQKLLEALRAGR
ncbi:MAG: lytic murein transglycosylase [Hyphomicrobiales bacterium]|nr:lytic murein transglycosylase [Hyphomicrobiales bacterium]MDE2018359.1 lytic murein transglycosylase [Hyphomicrobiales bacterium]